ncbi:MAG: hypothetical protein CMP21_00615 [Rickettsiales bacterium]|nr:hypothetical protein [Rickettsiales bacterium]
MQSEYPNLKQLLKDSRLVSPTFLNQFSNTQNYQLFEHLINHHIISEKTLHTLFDTKLGIPHTSIKSLNIDPKLNKPSNNLKTYIPLYETKEHITIAVSNPYINIKITTHKKTKKILIPNHELQSYYDNSNTSFSAISLFNEAIKQKASDIHCYEQEDHSAIIFFRINGLLKSYKEIDPSLYSQLKQYLKLEAHLDLSIYQEPQEGHIKWTQTNITIDTRLSIIPTIHGDDIACRLFNQIQPYETFSDLGITCHNQSIIKQICHNQNGLILVTGPTGSGKTTTLYTMLRYLQTLQKQNIITLEDPIEKELFGIRQSNIKPTKGFSFASGLKAILRQDPDIIMIGEIRDSETAQIALEAAYTGHLVLSSLHTHNIKSTLLRLKQFKCDEFLTNYALRGIIAQKLINPTNNYQTTRYLDQEILSITKPITTSIPEDLNQAGKYIQFKKY